jgi:hypothetical protein
VGNPTVFTKALAAASANNIALSQTPVSGTSLTINGAAASGGIATLDTQRRVLLTFGSEAAPRTLVVTGTNDSGNPISETLAIPATSPGTVATLQDFLTVTSLVPAGGGWTAAVTVGTNTVGSSPWKLVDPHVTPSLVALNLNVTGTINCSIEYTYDAIQGQPPNVGNLPWTYPVPPQVLLHAVLQGVTTDSDGEINTPVRAWRTTVNSGAGSVVTTGTQAGIA